MQTSSRRDLAALAVLASMISVNLGAAIAKSLFAVVGFQGMTAYRIGVTSTLLLLLWRPWRFTVPREQWGNLIGFGVSLGLMNLTIYSAFSRIPIGIAVAIEVTGPLLVVLLTSRTLKDLALFLLAVVGLGMLLPFGAVEREVGLDPVGMGFAAAAALCWAMYIMFGKRVSTLRNGQAVTYGMVIAATFALPLGFAHAGNQLFVASHLLTGVGVALLSSLVPYSLEMAALRHLPMRVFGLLVSASPAIAALASFLVLHEHLTVTQWVAIACVITASACAAWSAEGSPEAESAC